METFGLCVVVFFYGGQGIRGVRIQKFVEVLRRVELELAKIADQFSHFGINYLLGFIMWNFVLINIVYKL